MTRPMALNVRTVFSAVFSAVSLTIATFILIPLTLSTIPARAQTTSQPEGMEALKRLPIQDAGRIKPFDTFARETLQMVYGKTSYKPLVKPGEEASKDLRSRSALEIVMTWFLAPQFWDEQPIVELKLAALKEALNLEKTRDRFSPRELFANDRLGLVFQDLASHRETKEKLNPYFQSVARLENQLGVYQAVKDASILRLVPPHPEAAVQGRDPLLPKEPDRWRSVRDLDGALKDKFGVVAKSFIRALPGAEATLSDAETPTLLAAVEDFKSAARAENSVLYPDGKDIGIEVHYEEFHPFRVAWIIYVLSAIAMGIAWNREGRAGGKPLVRIAWGLAILAFLIHSYGFGLRMYLTGRPPVSNMYESVIWVSWGTMLFAFIFEFKQKARFVLLAGTVVATLCNIVADGVPHVLDGSLQPLEPVLRSNLWLTVHVLTISISYSAYFLAWALGNIGLGFVARGEGANSPRIEQLTIAIYRCMQVGVVLLAAGTILGGVWADYSWGRFWGWDPKETWALIALLGYLALLHARLSGWVKSIGMLVGAVVSFNLVIMAWYGVNFVLGAGLHSYGFGAGGVEYVSALILLNMAFVGYAYSMDRARQAIGT
jgi:cytochrome c-type biogenesis protein CcsB